MESIAVHNTFVIERHYPAPPERVFAAFSDPVKKRQWFVNGHGHEVEHYEMDFRVGGKEQVRVRFKEGTPVEGMACTNNGLYQEIIPDQRIVMASTMVINEKCISASLVTIEFLPADAGTDLIVTHQGAFFEGADGPAMREAGWRLLLDRLNA